MSRPFRLKAVLRHFDLGLLRTYLRKKGMDVPPSPDLRIEEVDHIEGLILGLPSTLGNEISEGLREVHEMSTEDGLLILLDVADMNGIHPQGEIETLLSDHDKALFFHLKYPKIFDNASVLYHVTDLKAKVERFLKMRSYDLVSARKEALAEALKSYLLRRDGRGRECTVNVFRYEDRICFMAYPEDFAKALLVYEDKQLSKTALRPTFEIVYLYHPETGKVELSAKGSPRRHLELFTLFNSAVLEDNSEVAETEKTYSLERFLDKDLTLPTEPADQVEFVRLQKLRLFNRYDAHRLTLELKEQPWGIGAMHALMEKLNIRQTLYSVSHAEIKMKFPGKGRRGGVTIQLSFPDKCNLNDSPTHLKAKKYLEQWGLVNRDPVQKSPASVGREPSPAAV